VPKHKMFESIPMHDQGLNYRKNICELEDHVGENGLSLNWPIATLTLGSRPRQGGCKGVGQERDPRVTSNTPGSAKSVRVHTLTLPSELPCWELESRMESQIFRVQFQGSKLISLKSFLYRWKTIEM
jgi:hypothetical protein